jgi:hypothetical protein
MLGLSVAVLLLAGNTTGAAQPFCDFDDGTLQGWTKHGRFNGDLDNPGSGGNPGGFMHCGDTMAAGGTLQAAAPSEFTGDLSDYIGIEWDEYLYYCYPSPGQPTFPLLVGLVDSDTTIYQERWADEYPIEVWRARFVPFVSTAWERISGSADFQEVLQNVVALRMNMECNGMCYDESGIDNIGLVPRSYTGYVDWTNHLCGGSKAFISPTLGESALYVELVDEYGYPVQDAEVTAHLDATCEMCFCSPLTAITDENGSAYIPIHGGLRLADTDCCLVNTTVTYQWNSLRWAEDDSLSDTREWLSIDLDGDCRVDNQDQYLFSQDYGSSACRTDYDCSGTVDYEDYDFFSAHMNEGCDLSAVCCFTDGSCGVMIEAECLGHGGEWHAEWQECSPNPCPSVGACCFDDGTCGIMFEHTCIELDGDWHPEWESCDPNPCPPVMACCFPDGACEIRLEAECTEAGGIWQPDSEGCEPDPCPPILVCCYPDGSCEIGWEVVCIESGGDWYPEWGNCEPNPCPQPPPGPCCFYQENECQMLIERDCLAAGGFYAGLLFDTCEEVSCTVENADDPGQPHGTHLHAGRPNPFRNVTVLEYDLEQPCYLSIAVYDVSGRLVRNLISTSGGAGRGSVTWDGRNEAGGRVSPGIYFCRMTTDGNVTMQRLTVVE